MQYDLISAVRKAEKNKVAIAHFNIATLEQMNAIASVAKKLALPVLVGVSEGEREFMGLERIIALRDAYRKEGIQMYVNADHTRSFAKVEEAARAGCDAIIFDAAHLSLEENIAKTKIARNIVKKYSRFFKKIVFEGELGYIGTSSELLDAVPEGVSIENEYFTKSEDAIRFVRETGVDMLAPAVGNIHGMLAHTQNPNLDIPRIAELRKHVNVPLVLHGGSGISENDFIAAINAGISIIHISTELRIAWKRGIEKAFAEKPREVAPYKILAESVSNLKALVEERMRLFAKMR